MRRHRFAEWINPYSDLDVAEVPNPPQTPERLMTALENAAAAVATAVTNALVPRLGDPGAFITTPPHVDHTSLVDLIQNDDTEDDYNDFDGYYGRSPSLPEEVTLTTALRGEPFDARVREAYDETTLYSSQHDIVLSQFMGNLFRSWNTIKAGMQNGSYGPVDEQLWKGVYIMFSYMNKGYPENTTMWRSGALSVLANWATLLQYAHDVPPSKLTYDEELIRDRKVRNSIYAALTALRARTLTS